MPATRGPKNAKIVSGGDSLDTLVSSTLKAYNAQVAAKSADMEARFTAAVAAGTMSLADQLAFRKTELLNTTDKTERDRINVEIGTLNEKIAAQDFSDKYTQQLIGFESGASSIDSVIGFLQSSLANTVDPSIRSKIQAELTNAQSKKFTIQSDTLKAATTYATQNKTPKILADQLTKLNSARAQAVVAGQTDTVANIDLQIQSLQQAQNEASINDDLKNMAVSTLAGYLTATGTLDAFNAKISSSKTDGSVTVNGVTYDSPQQYWTSARDQFIANTGSNGFFPRMANEAKDALNVKDSQGVLTTSDVSAAAGSFAALAARPELANYGTQIATFKQDVLQTGVNSLSSKIESDYSLNLDVNAAYAKLDVLKNLGANVDQSRAKITTDAGKINNDATGNILQAASQYVNDNPGTTLGQAVDIVSKQGAGSVISPTQAVAKTPEKTAAELAAGQSAAAFKPDVRTTATNPSDVPATPPSGPPPTVPGTPKDISSQYGLVNGAVYRKSDNQVFHNPQEFFNDAGVSSFDNLKFDTAYKPPAAGASPSLAAAPPTTPTAPTATAKTYKVSSGDTLSAISQKLLGSASRYQEIAKLNNISDPNKIQVGQTLTLPG